MATAKQAADMRLAEIRGRRRPSCRYTPQLADRLKRLVVETYSVDSQDAQSLSNKGDHRVNGLEQESLFVTESDSSENVGRIVLNDGDTGHLDRELQNDTEENSSKVGWPSEDLFGAS